MITFHTKADRIIPLIKTLAIWYYDNISHIKGASVEWKDSPTHAWDSTAPNHMITIELHDQNVQDSLIYNLTLFVSTGTIRVQGHKFNFFVEKHFSQLLQILEFVLSGMDSDKSQTSVKTTCSTPDTVNDLSQTSI